MPLIQRSQSDYDEVVGSGWRRLQFQRCYLSRVNFFLPADCLLNCHKNCRYEIVRECRVWTPQPSHMNGASLRSRSRTSLGRVPMSRIVAVTCPYHVSMSRLSRAQVTYYYCHMSVTTSRISVHESRVHATTVRCPAHGCQVSWPCYVLMPRECHVFASSERSIGRCRVRGWQDPREGRRHDPPRHDAQKPEQVPQASAGCGRPPQAIQRRAGQHRSAQAPAGCRGRESNATASHASRLAPRCQLNKLTPRVFMSDV